MPKRAYYSSEILQTRNTLRESTCGRRILFCPAVLSRKRNASCGKQRQKVRESGKTKEKVACVELPQLAETAPLAAPLARFGKIARTASKHGTSICSFGFSIFSTTGLPDPNRRSPGKRTRADRILIDRGSVTLAHGLLSESFVTYPKAPGPT